LSGANNLTQEQLPPAHKRQRLGADLPRPGLYPVNVRPRHPQQPRQGGLRHRSGDCLARYFVRECSKPRRSAIVTASRTPESAEPAPMARKSKGRNVRAVGRLFSAMLLSVKIDVRDLARTREAYDEGFT
jgi:hypothetical protein